MQEHSKRFHDMFAQRCATRIIRIQGIQAVDNGSRDVVNGMKELHQELHDILGEASLLDLSPIVETSRRIDQVLCELELRDAHKALRLGLSWCERISRTASRMARGIPTDGDSDLEALRREAEKALAAPDDDSLSEDSKNDEDDESEAEDFMRRRVLVLDDSDLTREALAAILEDNGYEVEVAGRLAEFETKLNDFKPEMILTDLYMPEIQGDQICKALKRRFDTADIPIIMISGLPEETLASRAKTAGADGWISKEHGPEALIATLEQMLSEIIF